MTTDPTVFSGHLAETIGDKVVVTLKAGPGYDCPWVVFHAGSNAEAMDLLGEAEAVGLWSVVGKAAADLKAQYNVGAGLGATPVQSPAAASQGYYQPDPPPSPQTGAQGGYGAPPDQPPGPAPACPHGTKVYKPAGVSQKTGKAFGATWNCPLKVANWRDPNGCATQWINNR